VLIAGRGVMGLGAAASEPGTLSMLRQLYPDARARSRAVGVWAATSGFALAAGPVVVGAAEVIILLCASAVLFAAFGWWEHRAPYPLLDLRFLRIPEFTTAIVTAF